MQIALGCVLSEPRLWAFREEKAAADIGTGPRDGTTLSVRGHPALPRHGSASDRDLRDRGLLILIPVDQ